MSLTTLRNENEIGGIDEHPNIGPINGHPLASLPLR